MLTRFDRDVTFTTDPQPAPQFNTGSEAKTLREWVNNGSNAAQLGLAVTAGTATATGGTPTPTAPLIDTKAQRMAVIRTIKNVPAPVTDVLYAAKYEMEAKSIYEELKRRQYF